MTNTLVGWGYEGQELEDLLSYCKRLHIHIVVDIRLNAISRKRGFSKSALSRALSEQGISYVHLRALGNPKDNRPGFAHPGTAEAKRAHARFNTEVLDTEVAREQLEKLNLLTEAGNVLVLCFEKAPDCCHRHLVLQRLQTLQRQKSVALF